MIPSRKIFKRNLQGHSFLFASSLILYCCSMPRKHHTPLRPLRKNARLRERVQLTTAFALSAEITPHEKMVYLVLAAYSTDEGRCVLKQRTIAEHCKRSVRFVRQILARLRQKQCIRTVRRLGATEFELLQ